MIYRPFYTRQTSLVGRRITAQAGVGALRRRWALAASFGDADAYPAGSRLS